MDGRFAKCDIRESHPDKSTFAHSSIEDSHYIDKQSKEAWAKQRNNS